MRNEGAAARRWRYLFLLFPLLLLLAGCSLYEDYRPLENVELVETLGIDPGQVSAAGAEERLEAEGDALPGAMAALTAASEHGGLSFAHTQFLLVSEAEARAGLAAVLDLAARNEDMRLVTPLYVLKGAEAAEVLLNEDVEVTAQLTALRTDAAPPTCLEIIDGLTERGCALVQAVEYADDALTGCGYGILMDGKLAGYLDEDAAMAAQLLQGRAVKWDIALDDGSAVRIEQCRRRVKKTADEIRIRLELGASVTAAPGRSVENTALAAAAEDAVCREAAAVLRTAQELGADLLELGHAETVTVEVHAKITETHDLGNGI